MLELVETLGAREVAQPHEAEVAQRHVLRQPVGHERDDRLRQQDLPAVRRTHDARGAVDRAPEEVAVAALDRTAVETAAHAQREAAVRRRLGERQLQFEDRRDRVERVVERGVHAVAQHLDDRAAMPLHGAADERVVARERRAHPLGLLLPEPAAALDVREQERDEAGGGGHGDELRGFLAPADAALAWRAPVYGMCDAEDRFPENGRIHRAPAPWGPHRAAIAPLPVPLAPFDSARTLRLRNVRPHRIEAAGIASTTEEMRNLRMEGRLE